MTIRRKPVNKHSIKPNAEVEAIINKGGATAIPEKKSEKKLTSQPASTLIRTDTSVLNRIDSIRKEGISPKSRNAWVLEAIAEKLARDE